MDKLYVIDAAAYLFRSYFAIRHMTNKKGASTNALFGFIRSVQKIIKDFEPKNLVAIFDGPDNKKSRTDVYEKYKAHRTGMPEDLFPQLDLAIDFCKLSGIPQLEFPGVEADDTIGAVALWAAKKGTKVFLCSNDKDLAQLVCDKIVMVNTYKDNLIMDRKGVKEHYGVYPEQIADYLALMGDASDNIPGVPGIGKKTAAELLTKYDSIEKMLKNPDIIENPKQRARILENEETLLLCQKLSYLYTDMEIPTKSSFYQLGVADHSQLSEMYREMGFFTLLREIGGDQEEPIIEDEEEKPKPEPVPQGVKRAPKGKYHLVDTEIELSALVSKLSEKSELCVDVETTHWKPMEAEIVGIGLGYKSGEAWYIPFNGDLGAELAQEMLRPLLENKKINFFGHNIKYDLHVLMNAGIEIESISFDTILASYLLNPQSNRHSLDQIVLERFNVVKTPIKELLPTKKKTMDTVKIQTVSDYCCEDVDYTCQLKDIFEKELPKKGLDKVFYDIELPLIWVLLRMEHAGLYIDVDKLKDKSKLLAKRLTELKRAIYKHAGEEFNLNSPKQLSDVLFNKLQLRTVGRKKATGYSTGIAVLESLKGEHPIINEIIDYRIIEKLRSTYVDALPEQICPKTGRIHCTFNQSVTATGRLSCQDPNLQNIPIRTPEGKKVREAFVPEKRGSRFLSADYSQVELRILAHLTGDPSLIHAFKAGHDIHAATASAIFNIPLSQVTPDQRRRAKAVNFGIIYGQQAYGLSQSLGIDFHEAKDFISIYFESHPKVQAFIEKCKSDAHKSGVAKSMTGRIRPLPEINSKNPHFKAAAERFAVNTPIQGTQSDIIKLAMIQIDQELKNRPELGQMVLQIHDELLFEVPEDQVNKLKVLVKSIMEKAYPLKVPLEVDISIGRNWGECYN
ncbi:MAG: DNA polymerase I [Chlamydiales bacterium]|nr:DNA polymerase I [Chlamydiales bacterium]